MTRGLIDRETLVAFASGRLSGEDSLRVLSSIEKDPRLSAELEEILLLMRATEEKGTDAHRDGRRKFSSEPYISYTLRIAAVVIVGFLSVVAASEVTKDRYCDIANVNTADLSLTWRGDSDPEIESARVQFIRGDREASLKSLEQFVRYHPADESASVVHYLIGAILLESSRRDLLGLFPGYDTARVHQALVHLAEATRSGNPRLVEEAHVLRIKALLMLRRPEEAVRDGKDYLNRDPAEQKRVQLLLGEIQDR
jgi:hypothetical protein